MKIATWNINGVRGRLPLLLKWLAKAKPDVVALQELKTPDDLFPEAELRKAGYGVVWAGERAYNGVALLARCVLYHYASVADGQAMAARGHRVATPGEVIDLAPPAPPPRSGDGP